MPPRPSPSPEAARGSRLSRPVARVRRAARPIAVASLVALSTTGIGLAAVPAASAEQVQQRLIVDGYLDAEHGTGQFDPRTGAAVARWQADRGLQAHGLVDELTADRLLGNVPSPQSPPDHP